VTLARDLHWKLSSLIGAGKSEKLDNGRDVRGTDGRIFGRLAGWSCSCRINGVERIFTFAYMR